MESTKARAPRPSPPKTTMGKITCEKLEVVAYTIFFIIGIIIPSLSNQIRYVVSYCPEYMEYTGINALQCLKKEIYKPKHRFIYRYIFFRSTYSFIK